MSDDNHISEDIASIMDAAMHVAKDSDAMRQNLVGISDKLQYTIQQAGIDFATEDTDFSWSGGEGYYYRLAVVKMAERHIVVEEDYSRNDTISIDEARARGATRYIRFAEASRDNLEEVVHRLPTFLTSYAAELKRRHKRYAALRDITDRMSNDMQEMN